MFENTKQKVAAAVGGSGAVGTLALVAPSLALAEGSAGTIDTITSSMTTSFTTFVGQALSAIGSIVPVVLPILGAFTIVTIGIRTFKKFRNG